MRDLGTVDAIVENDVVRRVLAADRRRRTENRLYGVRTVFSCARVVAVRAIGYYADILQGRALRGRAGVSWATMRLCVAAASHSTFQQISGFSEQPGIDPVGKIRVRTLAGSNIAARASTNAVPGPDASDITQNSALNAGALEANGGGRNVSGTGIAEIGGGGIASFPGAFKQTLLDGRYPSIRSNARLPLAPISTTAASPASAGTAAIQSTREWGQSR